jgi:hypothetical protein
MLGVVLAVFGFKEMLRTNDCATPLLRGGPEPFDSKSVRYSHEYDSIENISLG